MASLPRRCIAEAVGTGFIVLFVSGSITCQIAFEAYNGLLQGALISGLGVALAILSTVAVSGAHLNPAVSLTLALLRRDKFPLRELPAYVAAQMLGGFIASAVVFASLGGALMRKDELRGIRPGDAASVETAAGFGDYFNADHVDSFGAFAIEALGTGILMFMIFALTDERNPLRPSPGMIPFFVGMTVTVLISLFAPLTMAGWNPARDFPPRIIAMLVGYGDVALPGPHGGAWAYSVGPCFGAIIGGLFYDYLIAPGLPVQSDICPSSVGKDEVALPNLLEMREIVANKVVSETSCDVVVPSADKGDSMC